MAKNYWTKRSEERLLETEKNSEAYIKRVQAMYTRAKRNIQKEINNVYKNYASEVGVNVSELKKLLSKAETAKTWQDLQKQGLDKYIRNNYKSRITRLEQIKAQIYAKAKEIAPEETAITGSLYRNILKNGYYQNIYDVQQGLGISFGFSRIDDKLVNTLLSERWSGKNYSERIWGNTDILANTLSEELGGGLISGASLEKIERKVRERFDVAKYYSQRLIRTEANHFHNQADLEAYKEMGVEEYVFVATLDNRTSQICQELDGKRFKADDAQEGENYPPMHPNCRSTTRAYIDEISESLMERRARDPETGKTEVVGNVTYKEWWEKYEAQNGQDKSKGKRFTVKSGQMQYYKTVKIDTEDEVRLEHFYKKINAKKISSTYNDNIYLSESVKNVKARKIHELDTALSKTYKILGEDNIKNFEKPNIVIVSNGEMNRMIPASYSLAKNTIFLHEELFKMSDKVKELQVGYVEPTKLLSTILHENIHWYDLQRYIHKNGVINSQQTYNKYAKYLNEKFKKTIENNGAIIYNVSRYATISYKKGEYDEVFTEYRVSKLLKGNSFNSLQDDDIKYGYDDVKEMQRLWKDVRPYLLQNIDIDRVEMDDLFIKKTPSSIIKKYNQYKSLYDNRYGM